MFEKIKGFFVKETIKEVIVKAKEELGTIITPVFKELPPDNKAGKFIEEGSRSWAFIAMQAIADEISTTELELYKRNKKDWDKVENNQIIDLINKPNPAQTKEEHLWLTTLYLLAEGEAPWLLNDSKNPTEMILINPSRLRIKYDEKELIGSYKYTQRNGTDITIDKDNIIFLKLPSHATPFRGMGVMKYIAQTLDIDNYMEEYLRMFFFNDATPGAVLETDQTLTKEIIKRLRTQFMTRHNKVKNAHKLAILEKGLKWKETSNKLSEMQIKELQEGIRNKILAAFKVPKSIVGITEDVNRANGENEDRIFARRSIKPKLKMIQAQLNQFLLPKFSEGKNLWFEFENPVEADKKLQAEIDKMYIDTGVYTPNEVRETLGLKPIKGKVETEKHSNPRMINKYKGTYKPPKKRDDVFLEVAKDLLENGIKKKWTENEIEKFHKDKLAFTDPIEEEYKEKLGKYFKKQQTRILEQLKGKKAVVSINKDKEAELIAKLTIPYLSETILKESELAFALLGMEGKIKPQDRVANEFIQSRSLKLGKSASDTTKNDIQRILRDWGGEKESIAELKNRLRDYFGRAEINRATTIARTEVSRAAGFAQEEVYKSVGAVSKQWRTAPDERVCEWCKLMHKKVIDINKNFWNQGETMVGAEGGRLSIDFESISTPPLHPNCRCDLIPIFIETPKEELSFDDFKKKNQTELKRIERQEKAIKELKKKQGEIKNKGIAIKNTEEKLVKKEKEIDKTLTEIENELQRKNKKT